MMNRSLEGRSVTKTLQTELSGRFGGFCTSTPTPKQQTTGRVLFCKVPFRQGRTFSVRTDLTWKCTLPKSVIACSHLFTLAKKVNLPRGKQATGSPKKEAEKDKNVRGESNGKEPVWKIKQ